MALCVAIGTADLNLIWIRDKIIFPNLESLRYLSILPFHSSQSVKEREESELQFPFHKRELLFKKKKKKFFLLSSLLMRLA